MMQVCVVGRVARRRQAGTTEADGLRLLVALARAHSPRKPPGTHCDVSANAPASKQPQQVLRPDNAYTDCAPFFLADKSPFRFFRFLICAFTHHHDGPHRACLVLRCVPSRLPVRPMQARAIEQTNRNRQLQRGLGATPGSRTASTTASARVEQEAISRISWTFIAAKPPR
jgi:hypothetical protein